MWNFRGWSFGSILYGHLGTVFFVSPPFGSASRWAAVFAVFFAMDTVKSPIKKKTETHNMGWTYDSKLMGSKMRPQQEKISYIHIHRSHALFKKMITAKTYDIMISDIIDTPHHAYPPTLSHSSFPGIFWTSRLEDGPGAIAWVHQGREESPERLKEICLGDERFENQGTWF